jgi:NSS family neurotransmitter:Na+ symporter
LTSAISLTEPAVAWVVETFDVTRRMAAVRVGIIIWLLGFASVLSFSTLAEFKFWRGTLFDNLDYLTLNIILPLGGLGIVVFASWVMCQNSSADELGHDAGYSYRIWRFLSRYVAPVGVILVFLHAIGVIDAIGLFG